MKFHRKYIHITERFFACVFDEIHELVNANKSKCSIQKRYKQEQFDKCKRRGTDPFVSLFELKYESSVVAPNYEYIRTVLLEVIKYHLSKHKEALYREISTWSSWEVSFDGTYAVKDGFCVYEGHKKYKIKSSAGFACSAIGFVVGDHELDNYDEGYSKMCALLSPVILRTLKFGREMIPMKEWVFGTDCSETNMNLIDRLKPALIALNGGSQIVHNVYLNHDYDINEIEGVIAREPTHWARLFTKLMKVDAPEYKPYSHAIHHIRDNVTKSPKPIIFDKYNDYNRDPLACLLANSHHFESSKLLKMQTVIWTFIKAKNTMNPSLSSRLLTLIESDQNALLLTQNMIRWMNKEFPLRLRKNVFSIFLLNNTFEDFIADSNVIKRTGLASGIEFEYKFVASSTPSFIFDHIQELTQSPLRLYNQCYETYRDLQSDILSLFVMIRESEIGSSIMISSWRD